MKPRTVRVLGVITVAVMTIAGCTSADNGTESDQQPEGSTQSPGSSTTPPQGAASSAQEDITSELTAIEYKYDARVGVHAMDTGDETFVEHRSDERFGFASTIKSLAVAQLLATTSPEQLDEQVTWTKEDVVKAGYAPVTKKHLDDGLPLGKVAESALRVSDNAAANIVFDHIDGPEGLDSALEELGDSTTEVIDREPDLNTIKPGSTDNTTTPSAFSNNLEALLDTEHLSAEDRTILFDWMSGNSTGDPLIRAGAPEGWKVADKSGHADALRNDVAVLFPPKRDPIVVAIMTEQHDPTTESDAALIEDTSRSVLSAFE